MTHSLCREESARRMLDAKVMRSEAKLRTGSTSSNRSSASTGQNMYSWKMEIWEYELTLDQGKKAKKKLSQTCQNELTHHPLVLVLCLNLPNGHGHFEYSLNSRPNFKEKRAALHHNKSTNVSIYPYKY